MISMRCSWMFALLLCGASFIVSLTGCATASQPAAMAATAIVPRHRSSGSVMVEVAGGSETTATTGPNISNTDFATAIRRSITESRLFAAVAGATPADYRLDVLIARVQQPMFGAAFSVSMECTWRLTHETDQEVVWEKAITSSFTGKWNDAFAGVTRLRMATEGAARNNISDAILQMGELNLK
jgi:hypothetical protein